MTKSMGGATMKVNNRSKFAGIVGHLFLWICATATSSAAAEFQVIAAPTPIITVSGDLVEGDHKGFIQSTLHLDDAIVLFQSNGGNLVSGLEIGKAIRLKNFATYVPDRITCASACALAWLGGTQRYMSRTARVGFHAAYRVDGGTPKESGMGNALVGAYLNSLGLPNKAVAYMTIAAPEEMQWLTPADAQKLGLNVAILDLPPPAPVPNITALPPQPVNPPAPIKKKAPPLTTTSDLHICRLKDTMVLGSPALVINGKQRRKIARGEYLRLVGINEFEDIRIALNAAMPRDDMVRLSILKAGSAEWYYLIYWWQIYSMTRINGSVMGDLSNYQVFAVDAEEFHRHCPRNKPKTLDLARD